MAKQKAPGTIRETADGKLQIDIDPVKFAEYCTNQTREMLAAYHGDFGKQLRAQMGDEMVDGMIKEAERQLAKQEEGLKALKP
jgi:hypothetical protein